MLKKIIYGFLSLVLAASFSTKAQETEESTDSVSKSTVSRAFPERNKDNLGVTLHIGSSHVLGDVRATWPGLSFGVGLRKSLGHSVSVRGMFTYGNAYGMELNPIGGTGDEKIIAVNRSINGADGSPNYIGKLYVENYHTKYMDASIQVMYNINNINFYKADPQWNLYVFGGLGGNWYNTAVNAQDGDDLYDFSTIDFDQSDDKIKSDLKNMFDDTYDTEGHQMILKDKTWEPNLSIGLGLGFQWKMNRRLALGAEYSITRVTNDYYDNRLYRAIFDDLSSSTDFDFLNYANINIEFRVGKEENESYWWLNPLEGPLEDIEDMKSKLLDATTDSDDDGVPDIFDDEPDTPSGASVNSKGVTSDYDGDGIPDYIDEEPFSDPNAVVDNAGNSIDSDGDGIPDHLDKEANTPPGVAVDRYGRASTTLWYLPMIFYDLDKDDIKAESYPSLKQVATVMKMYPHLKVKAIGNTDVRASEKYNSDLAKRRAKNAVDHLVENFGIDRSRFDTEVEGELAPIYPEARYESQHRVNRRVEFIPIVK